mgnify:FL=1
MRFKNPHELVKTHGMTLITLRPLCLLTAKKEDQEMPREKTIALLSRNKVCI